MRGSASRGIITKKSENNGVSKDWWQFGIFFIALVLRVFRVDILTEFLGDQGRTLLILDRWFTHGVLPLAGPTTLTGQHLGPMFYYLLAPGYGIAGVMGTVTWVAILGALSTLVLYSVVRDISSLWSARIVALLYAVSPFLIRADQVIWEPNLVPLFVLLFVYSYIYAVRTGTYGWWLATGIVSGILIQLHYPTLLFVGLVGLDLCYSAVTRIKHWKTYLVRGLVFAAGFFLPLIPFVLYEAQNRFADFLGILSIFAHGGGAPVGKRIMASLFMDYLVRVFGRTAPFMNQPVAMALLVSWLLYVLIHLRKFTVFLTLWLLIGLGAMARYPGVVYDHYLYFLIPVPFLMTGIVLSGINARIIRTAGMVLVLIIAAVEVSSLDVFAPKNSDIWRTSAVIRAMNDESRTTPFSFTLINSASYSDLHYRYFMEKAGLHPEPVLSTRYARLYIVCDTSSCPSVSDITSRERIPVMCYDEHCQGSYPVIRLSEWSFERTTEIVGRYGSRATVYRFARR